MKQEFNVTGKTVDEAYKKAVELYSVMGDISLEEVVNPGKKGFLGLFGATPAEIRISVDDGMPERKPKNKKPQQNQNQNQNKNNQPKQNTEAKPENKVQPEKKAQPEKKVEKPVEKVNEKKVEKKPQTEKKSAPVNASKEAPQNEEKKMIKDEDIEVTAEEKTLAMNFLKKFVEDAGLECTVSGDMTVNEKGFVSRLIVVEGKDASTLIGHRGETLDAIQYLSNLCLARKSEGDHKEYVKVVIDIENYREKREMALRALARRMAEKALKYQRNVLLEPMNPYERMIIHSEVQGIEGVSTHSVGYDENRKIVISVEGLKKKPYKKNNNNSNNNNN